MPRIKPKRKLPKPEQLTEPLGGELALYEKAANIYIHASRANTFPTSVLETMACGTPVIATAVGGIPEQIQDGDSSLFSVPPRLRSHSRPP